MTVEYRGQDLIGMQSIPEVSSSEHILSPSDNGASRTLQWVGLILALCRTVLQYGMVSQQFNIRWRHPTRLTKIQRHLFHYRYPALLMVMHTRLFRFRSDSNTFLASV
jgi:hypothetical protein